MLSGKRRRRPHPHPHPHPHPDPHPPSDLHATQLRVILAAEAQLCTGNILLKKYKNNLRTLFIY